MDDLRLIEIDEAVAAAVKHCYNIARGDTASDGVYQDGFSKYGRRQLYWKGRCDVATDIRKAFPEVFKEPKNESHTASKV